MLLLMIEILHSRTDQNLRNHGSIVYSTHGVAQDFYHQQSKAVWSVLELCS